MPRTSRNVRATEVATTAIPPSNAATDTTVDTTVAPTIASADAAQHASNISSSQLGPAGVSDKVPSSVVTNDGDISVTPISENAAQLASSNQPASVIRNPVAAATISIVNPSSLRCQQCGAKFSSMTQLAEHVRTEHRTGAGSLVTSPAINQAIESWLLTWEDLRLLAPTIATDALNKYMGEAVAKAPLLIVEDEGLCTSFLASDTISIAGLQREIVGFTWFMETLQMIPALPEGAVNHPICHTGWASKDSVSRHLDVRLSPPTHGGCFSIHYRTVEGIRQGHAIQPSYFPCQRPHAGPQVRSVQSQDQQVYSVDSGPDPRSRGRYVRFFDNKELFAVAYPGREVLMEANRNALFLDESLPDRVGCIGRAQNVSGDVSAHIDTYELCDDLTLAIREMYHNMLFSMHLDPASVMEIVQDVSQQLVAASIPFAQTDTILCPWAASTPTLQLSQVLNLLNVANNTSAALPLIEAAATLIMGITPLRMEPRILSEAIKRVPETTTIVPSPTGELTRLLKPLGNDYSAIYRCIAGCLYSGLVQMFISADAYPDPTQSITSIPAIWKSLIVMLAAPMTTDPHAAVKAFMSMANLLAQPEPIIIPAPGMTQSTPAVQFSHPEVWPPGFVDPTTLDRNRTPLLHALATMIHAHWPQPGVIQYGRSRLGSANLFLPANQLTYPWPTQPLPRITVGPTYDSAMFRWIDSVFGFYINVVNSRYVATIVGDTTRRTLTGLMAALMQVKTMTPFYIERMCPTEVAVVGGVTVFPPFQVPITRLDPTQVITNVMVSPRGPPAPCRRSRRSHRYYAYAAPIPCQSIPLRLSLLCCVRQTEATLGPSYHYGSAITPMFLSEELFTRNQRAVIASEAFVCARSIIAQCVPDGFQVPRPLQDFNQYNASGSTAADLLKAVDDMFKTAFDIDGSLIEGIGLYGDPRVADLSVAYLRQNGAVERVHTAPDSSFLHEAMQVTSQVMVNEPNLWAIARGDIILAQNATHNNWDPLNPVGLPIFARGGPNVHVVGSRGMIIPQPGGLAPMIRDDAGNPQQIEGDWIYPISVLQVSVANFRDHVWPMIQAGRTRVRIEMGHFLYSIHYHEPFGQITEAPAIDTWLAGISPTGIPPFPLSAPIPQITIPITARRVYFGYCTMNNTGATFSTLGAAIQSAWGTDVTIQRNRWPALIDPNYIPGQSQLPARVQLYNPLRRYNYRYPSLKGMLYIPGVE
ncbi:putative NTPase/RNA helicase [Chum salmon reovirus CS]|uniref:Inner capsid protein VP3 n=1 Tax=Aquareovirus A (isolate Chum salmon/Japan/CSRV/1981) TaxID=928295 RepID=CAPSD_AQRVA|nr:putative NTPase/RNA helicase [Chum salmon reovirus CS]Q8VA41.1 RecName: Full=Major inner capsid protein VP3; AltName: Full=ATP-dependent DNA helicase VP3 [Aquareovirus A Chum salmon/Japan/CSRV/1981]AAL31498.1 putative NTPase/RNA helicase [Chum salmon reovirus CS]